MQIKPESRYHIAPTVSNLADAGCWHHVARAHLPKKQPNYLTPRSSQRLGCRRMVGKLIPISYPHHAIASSPLIKTICTVCDTQSDSAAGEKSGLANHLAALEANSPTTLRTSQSAPL
jgi:hypothetical protein